MLLLYSEKVNSIRAANQKQHVGPLVKCKKEGRG